MRTYISIGRVSEALMLMKSMSSLDCSSINHLRDIRVCYGINKEAALNFACQCKWVSRNNELITLTKRGKDICSYFTSYSLSQSLWQSILKDYIIICRPSWSSLIPSGRKETYFFMSDEERRCFIEAGLMDRIDEDIINWWDSLAQMFRTDSDDAKNAIGRSGERLTIKYENHRTGKQPLWKSIDSNKAGFDVLSVESRISSSLLYIEVKASKEPINEAIAYISRHEWEIASANYNKDKFLFYFWHISNNNRLAIIGVDEIRPHIPTDGHYGRWQTVSIPFSTFEGRFQELTL